MANKTKSNPIINFGFAILQFTLAVIGASLVAWSLDNLVLQSYNPNADSNETVVLATWVIFFILLLFIFHRVMKRIRSNG